MIACLRLPDLPPGSPRLPGVLEMLSELTPHVEAEGTLELRADARRRRIPYTLPPAQMDEQQSATCYLDLGRLPVDDTLDAAHTLHRLLSTHFKLPAAVGLSEGKFPARVGALSLAPHQFLIVPPGREARFLAEFPVGLLPVDGETIRQLHLLGLRRLGQLAALPSSALLDRFGRQGQIMHRLASGRDTSRVPLYEPPTTLEARREFDWAESRRGPLAHALGEMAAELGAQLTAGAQTAGRVELGLVLEDGTIAERSLALREPAASPAHLEQIAGEMLDAMQVASGVVEVRLALGSVQQVTARQLSLFDREPVSRERLQAVLHSLAARYGEDCFYWAALLDPGETLPGRRFRLREAGAA